MRVTGLDGRESVWNFSKDSKRRRSRKVSGPHKLARLTLRDLFPRSIILEEVSLPGTRTTTRNSILYADFFIPDRPLIVEVHGEQHYSYNEFYHKNKRDFYQSKVRDRDKEEWCRINNIYMAVLDYREGTEEWRKSILNAIGTSG